MTDAHPAAGEASAAGSALTLVVCGAPLAARARDLRAALSAAGWSVSTVYSTAATLWAYSNPAGGNDTDTSQQQDTPTAQRVRPDVVVACPLTFNTANKIVTGVMDTPATGVLCDALGAGVPIVAVPMANTRLWGHPTWAATLTTLHEWGVTLLDPTDGTPDRPQPVDSGTGDPVAAAFDPAWVVAATGPAPSCG
jgi:hypothetical protein